MKIYEEPNFFNFPGYIRDGVGGFESEKKMYMVRDTANLDRMTAFMLQRAAENGVHVLKACIVREPGFAVFGAENNMGF